MPVTPTVSMCAFSISERPPPRPRATPITFGRPGAASSTVTSSPASRSQPATNRATSPSPAAPGSSTGLIESIATRFDASSTRVGSTAMDVLEIAPGLWRWSTRFGEWGHDVGCVYLETDDAVVLIDPLVPEEAGEEERFWRALDRDVKRAGVPVHVLVTVFWHTRSSARMVERYDATVHAVSGARADVTRRSGRVDHVYRGITDLPGAVVAHPTVRRNEVVLWLPEHR